MERRVLVRGLMMLGAALAGAPASAAKGKLALIPASVNRGAPENGRLVTEALRASLEKQGYTVTPEEQVGRALKNLNLGPAGILPLSSLRQLRDTLEVGHVVYPRVLSAGVGATTGQHQATILVNVLGKPNGVFVHTKQIAQAFQPDGAPGDAPLMHRADADAAVGKLMEAFYAK